MSIETIKVSMNPKEYFSKMQSEDTAAIANMCLQTLAAKANELKDLYIQLTKSYGIEMGLLDVTLLVQITSPNLPLIPVRGSFGTPEGIKHALSVMMKEGLKDIVNMNKEEKADENG